MNHEPNHCLFTPGVAVLVVNAIATGSHRPWFQTSRNEPVFVLDDAGRPDDRVGIDPLTLE
jgi:hypothetical protein